MIKVIIMLICTLMTSTSMVEHQQQVSPVKITQRILKVKINRY